MSTLDSTTPLLLPQTLYDFVIAVELKTPLEGDKLTTFLTRSEEWIRDEMPQHWTRKEDGHFIKLHESKNTKTYTQLLVYYGGGNPDWVPCKRDTKYLCSREFRLTVDSARRKMLDRLYMFSRLFFLPIKTKTYKTHEDTWVMEPIPRFVQPLHRFVLTQSKKCYHFAEIASGTLQDDWAFVHKTGLCHVFPPRNPSVKRYDIPIVDPHEETQKILKGEGYSFEEFCALH